jgi:hypothetical protein
MISFVNRLRPATRSLHLSCLLVAGLTASACGDDAAGVKDTDTDAQAGGNGGGSQGGASGGSDMGTGGSTGGSTGGEAQGGSTGGEAQGGSTGGFDKPDGGPQGGAGGEPQGGAGGEPVGGQAQGGSGGEPVGGQAQGGSGGEPVGGQAQGGAGGEPPPPPPVPDSDYAYARITTAAIANQGEASCPDFNGGGPDNAFAGLGAFVNGQLQSSIDEQSLNLLPVSIGLPVGAQDGQFAIAVLTGSDQPDGSYQVSEAALDADGNPLILFNPANADAGRLQAGPGNFTLQLPVQGVEVELNLTRASITGGIAVDANEGLTISTGTIAGQITQEDLDAALVVVPPEFVGLIPIFLQPDLDLDGNGTNDGYSLCLTFEATPATVIGYPVP